MLPTMHESDITQQNEQHLVSKVFDERLRPNIIIYQMYNNIELDYANIKN